MYGLAFSTMLNQFITISRNIQIRALVTASVSYGITIGETVRNDTKFVYKGCSTDD